MTEDMPRQCIVGDRFSVENRGRICVSVAGELQRYVISYDMDAGTVVRYERTPDERFVFRNGNCTLETVRGRVEAWLS